MRDLVFFKGNLYYIHSLSSIEMLETETAPGSFTILYNLHPVEPAQAFSYYNCFLVPRSSFVFLPSSINFLDSEWSQGVRNGQTK